MNLPILPPSITENRNPGSSSPADQSFAPVPADLSTAPPASASSVSSNGEQQAGNQDISPTYNGTVTQTSASAAVTQASGEGGQRLNLQKTPDAISTGLGLAKNVAAGSASHVKMTKTPQAVSTGHGLPQEVFPGSSNPCRNQPASVVPCTPPSITVNADTGKPGGLPVNVIIR